MTRWQPSALRVRDHPCARSRNPAHRADQFKPRPSRKSIHPRITSPANPTGSVIHDRHSESPRHTQHDPWNGTSPKAHQAPRRNRNPAAWHLASPHHQKSPKCSGLNAQPQTNPKRELTATHQPAVICNNTADCGPIQSRPSTRARPEPPLHSHHPRQLYFSPPHQHKNP